MENVSRFQVKEELRRRWATQAVEKAMRGEWDEAIQANLHILELFVDDTSARNRLGKAYGELGRLEESLTAYEDSLRKQPSNNIARKRLVELYAVLNREPAVPLGEPMPVVEGLEEEEEEIEELEEYIEEEEEEPEAAEEEDSEV